MLPTQTGDLWEPEAPLRGSQQHGTGPPSLFGSKRLVGRWGGPWEPAPSTAGLGATERGAGSSSTDLSGVSRAGSEVGPSLLSLSYPGMP